jgi:hypothetical protein
MTSQEAIKRINKRIFILAGLPDEMIDAIEFLEKDSEKLDKVRKLVDANIRRKKTINLSEIKEIIG